MSDLKDICPKCGSETKAWMERSPDGRSKCECGFEGKHTEWIKAQRVLDKVNALISTDDNAGAREYFLNEARIAIPLFAGEKPGKPDYIHVIEYAAYEKLRLERDLAVQAMNDAHASLEKSGDTFRENIELRASELRLRQMLDYQAAKLERAEAQNQRLRVDSKLNALNECRDQLTAERERSRKLREALEMYAMTSETFPEYGEVARDALATNGPLATEIEESNRALRLLEAEREKSGNLRHHLAGLIEMVKVEHGLECGVDYEINDTSAIGDAEQALAAYDKETGG